ncbi:MAG: superoxide dismutase family protein, partial [Proteobacteria bacterium]|nr:superoxide dismutase family protein [Pseudomonadota bacterium]
MRHFMIPAIVPIALAGCVSHGPASPAASAAHATLEARSGSTVAGTLQVAAMTDGVHVTGQVSGLAPNSDHGFHIHEKGDCSA